MTEIAVADSHGLIWYARSEWKKLGAEARKVYASADAGRAAIYVPTLVLVEIAEAARRGSIRLPETLPRWIAGLFSSGGFFPVDLTPAIVLRAEELYEIPERGDRLIAATAMHLGHPLLTRDPEIGRIAGLRVIW
jgi:PIN domain nuclease of toxin-antitoxin system